MSSRLFVTGVVDKVKVIKHWYAKPARSDIPIAELFLQLLWHLFLIPPPLKFEKIYFLKIDDKCKKICVYVCVFGGGGGGGGGGGCRVNR